MHDGIFEWSFLLLFVSLRMAKPIFIFSLPKSISDLPVQPIPIKESPKKCFHNPPVSKKPNTRKEIQGGKNPSQPSSIEFLLIRNPPGHKLREIAADLSSKVGTRRDRYSKSRLLYPLGEKGAPFSAQNRGLIASTNTFLVFSRSFLQLSLTRLSLGICSARFSSFTLFFSSLGWL